MKQLKITVNGNTYDVLVEEVGAVSAPVAAAPVAVAAPAPAAAPAPVSAPVAPSAPVPAAASAGATTGEPVVAPMPGTILDVKVSAGQAISKGDVLCVLEAMKMENEIFADRDGVVEAVSVSKGDSVESGQTLVVIK